MRRVIVWAWLMKLKKGVDLVRMLVVRSVEFLRYSRRENCGC